MKIFYRILYLYCIKVLNHILLYLASLIILAHSLVPHQHHDELSHVEHDQSHVSADSFLDYLELVFHVDLGDEHLENFNSSDYSNLDIDGDFDISKKLHYYIIQNGIEHADNILLKDTFRPPLSKPSIYDEDSQLVRGPPFIS